MIRIHKSLPLNVAKDESRVAEDPRMTGRLERLGKEISVLKGKQTDHSTSIEYLGNKQTSTGLFSLLFTDNTETCQTLKY